MQAFLTLDERRISSFVTGLSSAPESERLTVVSLNASRGEKYLRFWNFLRRVDRRKSRAVDLRIQPTRPITTRSNGWFLLRFHEEINIFTPRFLDTPR